MRNRLSPVVLLVFFGCGTKLPNPLGRLREVTFVCRQCEVAFPLVESILGGEIQTPQYEREFRVKRGDYERFMDYSRMRLLFVLGTTEDTVIASLLGRHVDSLVARDYGLYRVRNIWARNQWVLVLAARHDSLLVHALRSYSDRLRQTLYEIVLEQMAGVTYFQPAQLKKSEELSRRYRFTLDVPANWLLEMRHDSARFVYIYGHYPDRCIFVYWVDRLFPLHVDSLLALRNRLTQTFYDGDVVNENIPVVAETIGFLNRPCLRLRGVWQNPREVIGGPFVSYSFVHQGRFFMIDGTLFNPGEDKLNNLFQLEAIIRTFTPR